MLEQHGGGDGVHVAFPSARGPAHLLDGALRRGGCESLVDEANRQPAPFGQLGSDFPCLGASLGLLALLVERQTDDEPLGLERAGAVEYLADGRSFAGSAQDVAGRRRDGACWIAYRESNASVTEVDREEAHKNRK